jgi:hypothetical protein
MAVHLPSIDGPRLCLDTPLEFSLLSFYRPKLKTEGEYVKDSRSENKPYLFSIKYVYIRHPRL